MKIATKAILGASCRRTSTRRTIRRKINAKIRYRLYSNSSVTARASTNVRSSMASSRWMEKNWCYTKGAQISLGAIKVGADSDVLTLCLHWVDSFDLFGKERDLQN